MSRFVDRSPVSEFVELRMLSIQPRRTFLVQRIGIMSA